MVEPSVIDAEPEGNGHDQVPAARGSQAQTQHLLLTLLGDYWYERDEYLPSAALVDLLAEFGVTAFSARAALNRLTRRSLLRWEKRGRRTFYALTRRAAAVLTEGGRRIVSFGFDEPSWDGRWTFVAFSVPEARRPIRHALRERLRWLGYAPLYDALWVSPRDRAREVREVLDELGLQTATLVTGTPHAASPSLGDPLAAWDLEGLRHSYEEFLETWRAWAERTRAGTVTPAEALVARTEVMDVWRTFPGMDPELPGELLPPAWPRAEARRLFIEIYDGLGPLAEMRVRQLFARHDRELADLATHHRTAQLVDS
ncbi:MAG: PaaX family transcriptional regulator [Streptosporangiales bacterium]|nr:PaaX family transcriptional regulator [Streptosporangiales bacterium]